MKIYISLCFLLTTLVSNGQELPEFFSDNMVLQRNDTIPIWGKDLPFKRIIICSSWGNNVETISDGNGNWRAELITISEGGPYTIQILGSNSIEIKNVLLGEVWFASGQSNMDMPLRGFTNNPVFGSNEAILTSKNNNIRFFKTERAASLEPISNVKGKWVISDPSSSPHFSAIAYFYAQKIEENINVPIGIITSTWGGSKIQSWMAQSSINKFREIKVPQILSEEISIKRQTPTALFNAMVHPFQDFKIKGILWYQGESDRSTQNYEFLFGELITSWREKWNNNKLPFYFVQIAPFNYRANSIIPGRNSAFIREAQLNTYKKLENVGIVITTDVGDCANVHPGEKKVLGDRLAYWALGELYGVKGISYLPPILKEVKKERDNLILTFDNAEQGFYFSKDIRGFEVAGKDGKYKNAHVTLNSDKSLTLSHKEISAPQFIRYNFCDCPNNTLLNNAGIPLSSFRTDEFED